MIQSQIKLKLTPRQDRTLTRYLRHLTAIWNWGVGKIPRDLEGGAHYSSLTFRNLLNGHGRKMDLPQDAICGTLWTVYNAWQRCFKGTTRRPRFKGRRNRLNSIAFAHGTRIVKNRVLIPGLGWVRFHKQSVPGCGSLHDRDQNSAINAFIDGVGMTLERKVA